MPTPLKVMVLAGGPDAERPVSLASGQNVAHALAQAGHEVRLRDITPDNLSALDEFRTWPGDVIFPILHGPWGEGGPLQEILESRSLPFVGSSSRAARLCMDKALTKSALAAASLPTPPWQVLQPDHQPTLSPPLVIKPVDQGSSIDVRIIRSPDQLPPTLAELWPRYSRLLLEQFVPGTEVTVPIIADPAHPDQLLALPPIRIETATGFYDYQAKYHRDDTQYHFDLGLPADCVETIKSLALRAFQVLGCRHLARLDLIVDHHLQPWILEINTLPGFTSHSLLPKAAAYAGIPTPRLVDHLVRLALSSH